MTYQEEKQQLAEEQKDMSRDEIVEKLENESEYVFDPEQLKNVEHRWVKRGAKLSCEGAAHLHHSHFLH